MLNQPRADESIHARLDRLARTNRILTAVVIGLLGLWLAGAAQDEKPKAADVIKAKGFQIVDDSGTVLGELGRDKDGAAGVFLKDKEGRTRLSLMNDAKQSALYLFDDQGTSRVGAAHYAFNVSAFAIHGPQMKGGMAMVYKDKCSLTIDDNENKRVVELPATK